MWKSIPHHRLPVQFAFSTKKQFTRNMKTLGLLGGMTYHATLLYYEQINRHVQKQLGGSHSAKIVLQSFDFTETSTLMNTGKWDDLAQKFILAARNLEKAGAEAIVLCVNTGHKVADALEKGIDVPLLHIIDFCGEAAQKKGLKKVALLGTKPVMEEGFMKARLKQKFGLEVVIPGQELRTKMHEIIFGELGRGIVTSETKDLFMNVVHQSIKDGAEGIFLACTELQFVIKPEDVDVPLFDTVELHAKGAADWALRDE